MYMYFLQICVQSTQKLYVYEENASDIWDILLHT